MFPAHQVSAMQRLASYAGIIVALPVLGSCDASAVFETSPTLTFYFRAGTADDLQKCPPKTKEDWHTAEFEFGGHHHEFISPLGLICVKDDAGRYIGTYVSAANSEATHQLEEGGSKNFIDQGPVFSTRTRQ